MMMGVSLNRRRAKRCSPCVVLLLCFFASADARAFEWGEASWQARYALLHAGILSGTLPAEQQRYVVWTCGKTGANEDCVGYANRLLGVASAFLVALLTDAAFLIHWPGSEANQLSHFFRSDLIPWKVTGAQFEDLKQRLPFHSPPIGYFQSEFELPGNGWILPAEAACFVDIFKGGHHDSKLRQLGLTHVDQVMGTLLPLLLQPTGMLLQEIERMHTVLLPCHVIGIQIRVAAEATDMVHLMRGSDVPMHSHLLGPKFSLSRADVPRFFASAQHLEEEALEAGAECVKWFLITDVPQVVAMAEQSDFAHKIVTYDGKIAHISKTSDSASHLKVLVDHWLFATADDAVLSAPSTFGLSARMLGLSGRLDFTAVMSQLLHEAAVYPPVRAVTERYSCGGGFDGETCMCNPFGFVGHHCPDVSPSVRLCPACIILELPLCRCLSSTLPFSRPALSLSILNLTNGSTVTVRETADTVLVPLRISDLPADIWISCSLYFLKIFLQHAELRWDIEGGDSSLCGLCTAMGCAVSAAVPADGDGTDIDTGPGHWHLQVDAIVVLKRPTPARPGEGHVEGHGSERDSEAELVASASVNFRVQLSPAS